MSSTRLQLTVSPTTILLAIRSLATQEIVALFKLQTQSQLLSFKSEIAVDTKLVHTADWAIAL